MSAMLSIGSKGEQVKKLQTALNRAGYDLSVDGVFGPATKTALSQFQHTNGLKADGIAGPNTWAVLDAYAVDYSQLVKVVEECLDAVEALPEYKRLEALLYG